MEKKSACLPARLSRWGTRRRLTDGEALLALEDWRRALEIPLPVRLERVRREQVSDHRGRRGCSLVGVVTYAEEGCIYHTRALMAEDLVHELLHIRRPDWSEQQVVDETDRLLREVRRPVRRQSRRMPAGAGPTAS